MSLRGKKGANEVARLRAEIEDLKRTAQSGDAVEDAPSASAEFDALNPTEQAVATLGVSPNAWKPITFMNSAHYNQLVSSNMLDDTLQRRIEAFRVVSGDGA